MEMENILAITSRSELRAWLAEHSKTAACCWLIVSMTPSPDTLLYLDAVEEALCFGWIDGVKKKTAQSSLAQRLSPRSRKSSWTELNKERVRRLERLGLMRDEGRRVLPDMGPDSFYIGQTIEDRLKEVPQAYDNFLAFPSLYQRIRVDTIQSVRHDPVVFESRLQKLIANSRDNKMYGQWHDNGRLLEQR